MMNRWLILKYKATISLSLLIMNYGRELNKNRMKEFLENKIKPLIVVLGGDSAN